MNAPACPACHGTGDATGQGFLDCSTCSAATDRAALNAFAKALGPMSQEDLLWLVHQRAVSQYAQDAERYRWLRDKHTNVGLVGGGCWALPAGEKLDQAIDAAIAQEKTK